MPSLGRIESFGALADGSAVDQLTLENEGGMRVAVLSYGGTVRSLTVPFGDAVADVVLGFDTVAEYEADRGYVGPLIGRFANRIAQGRFVIDGVEFNLPRNDGANHLHGGPRGFHRALWKAAVGSGRFGDTIELDHRSAAGDQGYPGALDVHVTFELTHDNAFVISYLARTDAPTHVNLTWHGYLNLAGHGAGDARDHHLTLAASSFTPVDPTKIPTGELRPVAGTPFDFRRSRPIRHVDGERDEQLLIGNGYDHNFAIDQAERGAFSFVARVVEPFSKRWLEIRSTEPGVQLHLGQHLGGRGKDGARYAAHAGFALETQHFPDAPNQPTFPSTLLYPGAELRSRTEYRFGGDASV